MSLQLQQNQSADGRRRGHRSQRRRSLSVSRYFKIHNSRCCLPAPILRPSHTLRLFRRDELTDVEYFMTLLCPVRAGSPL